MTATPVRTAMPSLSPRRRTIALWVVLLAFFMDLLDTTIVNVAIPSIQADLGSGYSAIQWIIAGYSLSFALFLITGGRLGDIFGYKTLFLAGMGGFIVASALSGLAPSTEVLIGARVAQGFTAAMMVPQILSTIQVMYPNREERQGVSAFYGALAGVATVAGPILGALLISGDFWASGWRAIFLINLPVGAAAVVLGAIYLPKAKSPHPLRLDLIGVGLILLAMLLLTYPLIQGRELDWPVWTFIAMAASLPVFVLFGWNQVAKDRRDGSPLVVPRLFRHRTFVVGLVLNGVFFAMVTGFFLTFTIFLQIGLGYSVLKAGLSGIPYSLGVSVAAGMSGPVLVPRFGRNIITAGPIVMIVGFALFLATVQSFGDALTPWELIPSLVVAGTGMGFVVAPIYPFILADVPIADAGSASGVITATSQIGGSVGIAAIGVIFFGLLSTQAGTSADGVRDALAADLAAAGVPAPAVAPIVDGFDACFRDRARTKDFSVLPASCRAAESVLGTFAARAPAVAAAIGTAIARRAQEAKAHNFTTAIEHTMIWQIGGLVVVCLLSFLLPPRPRTEGQPAAAGATAS